MDSIVNLTPDDPRAREAIIGLLGTTLSELREIDKNVVGSSKNISALRTDLKNVLNFPQVPPTATVVNAGANIGGLHVAPVQQQPTVVQPSQIPISTAPAEDPNQLVFDFNQKITPETVNNKLDRILDKLDRIIFNYIKQ
jgi:hypothetical protein